MPCVPDGRKLPVAMLGQQVGGAKLERESGREPRPVEEAEQVERVVLSRVHR